MTQQDNKAARQETKQASRSQAKPLKVLSTSLGIILAGHVLMAPAAQAAEGGAAAGPQLVEWSSDAVKAYFDPSIDWNIPLPDDNKTGQPAASPTPTPASGSGSTPVIVHNGGFGWDDLLLYHMIYGQPLLFKKLGEQSSFLRCKDE